MSVKLRLGQLDKLRAANHDRQREYAHGERFGPLFWAVATAGECGEACNVMKKLERARLGNQGKHASVDDLRNEMADMVVYLDLWAASMGIDLWGSIVTKFNADSEARNFRTRLEL